MYETRVVASLIAIFALLVAFSPSATASGDTAMGSGKVNAVMEAERKINITHGPIPKLGWMGMTMDFRLADAVSLKGIKPGSKVTFHLHKAHDGAYEIESLKLSEE